MHKHNNTIIASKEKKRKNDEDNFQPDQTLNFDQLESIIKLSNKKCSERWKHNYSCILGNYITNSGLPSMDKSIALLQECREITRSKNSIEKDTFLFEELRKSITNWQDVLKSEDPDDEEELLQDNLLEAENEVLSCFPCVEKTNVNRDPNKKSQQQNKVTKIVDHNKKGKFHHQFVVLSKENNFIPMKVCRMCWSHLFGFSKWKLDQAAFLIKDSNRVRPNTQKIDIYDDKTYHDFSHQESLKSFKDLGVGQKQGQHLLLYFLK